MAEIRLTKAQRAVVDDRGGALLVAAAAGSGKTKVLVDRLMARVCHPDHPANIDEFLLITYTKAAASELRGKIAAELSRRLAENPEDRHLQRQATRIYMTQISTVHAFCTAILREYAHTLDISADFRVAEEQECAALRQRVFEDLLEQVYADLDGHPARRALIDQLGYGRDDRRLADLVMPIYDAVRCRVWPEVWMEKAAGAYDFSPDAGAEQTIWGAYLMENLHRALLAAEQNLQEAWKLSQYDRELTEKYQPLLEENLGQVRALLNAETWDEAYAGRILSFGTLKPARKADAGLKERVQNLRKGALEEIRDAQGAFYGDSRRVMADLRSTAGAIGGLLELLGLFGEAYAKEKARRKLMDFSDLEHTAIRLLRDRHSGMPTAAARELSLRWQEILVDEYQDSNAVQECIFDAVSRAGQNRFMVGDVKQSIYRFRLANPGIFLEKYQSYASHEEAQPGQPRKILLSENFRSRKEILWAVNDVFRLIMSRQAGELDYGEEEALKPGREYPETAQKKVELHLLELESGRSEEGRKMDKSGEEAEFVARRIRQLLDEQIPIAEGEGTRPVRPGDIVILMRSPGSAAASYLAALARHGIPCVSDRGGNVLETTEGEVFCALLQIIDNPHRDIPLAAAMLSPVFAVSPDELASVRADRKGSLYDCLRRAETKSRTILGFLSWLDMVREKASVLTMDQLLDLVFDTVCLEEVFSAMEGGASRRENLTVLRQMAADNVQAYGGSLMGFCNWLDQLRESGTAVLPPQAEGADAVRIMSIHKSKGLEFPVVFLADLSRRFNLQDNASPVLLDEELTMGSHVVDTRAKAYYSGIARTAIALRKKRQTLAEEMRVLYVAMTRAKEMLIMTHCGAYLTGTLKRLNDALSIPLRPEVALSASCLGDWVLLAALCRTEAGALFAVCGPNSHSSVREDAWYITYRALSHAQGLDWKTENAKQKTENRQGNAAALEAALSFSYPHQAATALPSKLTATQLKGRMVDEEAAQNAPAPKLSMTGRFRRPSFRRDTPLTGREKGNATHLFMQYVRYEACTTFEALEEELDRLVAWQYLTARQAEAVDREKILTLFTGTFGRRILAADKVEREFKFSILTDAEDYAPGTQGEQVMLQGVVDCFWQEQDGLVIVEFKTDRIFGNLAEKAAGYTPQLQAYAKALGRIYGMPVKACYLYFFDAGTEIRI